MFIEFYHDKFNILYIGLKTFQPFESCPVQFKQPEDVQEEMPAIKHTIIECEYQDDEYGPADG